MSGFRAAFELGDLGRLDGLLHDGVVFRSPVVYTPYVGRRAVLMALAAVAEVLEETRWNEHHAGDDLEVLVFEARVGAREVQGVELVRTHDGLVQELTLMVRPMAGAQALADAMRRRLPPASKPPGGRLGFSDLPWRLIVGLSLAQGAIEGLSRRSSGRTGPATP
jgi:hypothetical protein